MRHIAALRPGNRRDTELGKRLIGSALRQTIECRKRGRSGMDDLLKATPRNAVTAALQTLESLARAGVKQLPQPRRGAAVRGRLPPAIRRASAEAASRPRGSGAKRPTAPDRLPAVRSRTRRSRPVASQRWPHVHSSSRGGRLHGLPRIGQHAHANRVRRGQSAGPAVLSGRSARRRRRRQGEPFVGRAGQLLTKIIEACTLRARTSTFSTCSSAGRRAIAIRCRKKWPTAAVSSTGNWR